MSNPNLDPSIYRIPEMSTQPEAGRKSWVSTQIGRVTGLLGEILSGTGEAVTAVVNTGYSDTDRSPHPRDENEITSGSGRKSEANVIHEPYLGRTTGSTPQMTGEVLAGHDQSVADGQDPTTLS